VSETVTIVRLGAQGDGVAETGSGPVFVPFTLPGERVNIARTGMRGTAMAVLDHSPDRISPLCRHFEECGGCAIQHLHGDAYRAWKRALVADALKARGLAPDIGELVAVALHSRRRATFTIAMSAGKIAIGFNAAMSNRIVELSQCPVLAASVFDALAGLKRLAALLLRDAKTCHATVTATASGLDVSIEGCGALNEKVRGPVTQAVLAESLARLTVEGETIVEPRTPRVMFGDIGVAIPPGGFLQAVPAAEAAMVALVAAHLGKAKRVADLFAGSGAFALPLAGRSAVHAVESDAAAVAALDKAWRGVPRLKPVTVERRDLFRRPLTAKELNEFQGVVFDPPRAGAEAQARQIAASTVRRVAAVSCNPATLARDLRILADGGYRIVSVTPIDQFLWSPHVEAVALLER
jgi:23S rRNA (uracil1939-C5)-methyltransferase